MIKPNFLHNFVQTLTRLSKELLFHHGVLKNVLAGSFNTESNEPLIKPLTCNVFWKNVIQITALRMKEIPKSVALRTLNHAVPQTFDRRGMSDVFLAQDPSQS
jgi:hypothetical protein